uniref:Uncharacterized protein n=1 Tax=Ditylenchus dipsaci TaxID=166011 RepID=A0A915CLP5_9BILA
MFKSSSSGSIGLRSGDGNGFVPLISTNNALERHNLDIKGELHILRQGLSAIPLTFLLPTVDEYKAAWKHKELSSEITDEPIGGKAKEGKKVEGKRRWSASY